MTKMKLSDYLDGLRAATTASELEAAIQAPYKHTFYGATWTRICKVRVESGNRIRAAHPLGKFVPFMDGRWLTVADEVHAVARGGNSAGRRYAWHAAGEFAKSVLRNHGFTVRACARIWDGWTDYPHRCLRIVEEAIAGGYPDPVMDTLTLSHMSEAGPIRYTEEQNNADACDRRATQPCTCGGTLFDWGSGSCDGFTSVNWRCNWCAGVFIEYVTPRRFREIRRPALPHTSS